ncbi:CRISPR-associated helicase/endonuclease Cas3 [Salinarchaeum chitinilyticum]
MAERYSHPEIDDHDAVALVDHLEDVANRIGKIVPQDKETPYGTPMTEFAETLGWVHDIGKATTWFQQYIGVKPGDPDGPKHHGPIGALAAYYALQASGYESGECLAGYVAVANHHGDLPDVPEYVFKRTNVSSDPSQNVRQGEVRRQVENIDRNAAELADEVIEEATDESGSWSDFRARIDNCDLFEQVKDGVTERYGSTPSSDALSDQCYPTVLQCWSALTLADKTSAAHADPSKYEGSKPEIKDLSSHIDELGGDAPQDTRAARLDELRSEARTEVVDAATEFAESGGGVGTITLPTGLGKTLTGLEAALSVREELDGSRVIYALPFTSIVDQVADEIEDVFDADPSKDLLTIHHHLAETLIELDGVDDEERDQNARIEEMLGESWRSGLVVTTFVQLFESLVGPKNSQSLKLPALYDSVIVVDEPQGLPHNWWKLVRRLGEILTEEYDATLVAMTATQPRIFEDDATPLVRDRSKYYEGVERVEYEFDESVATHVTDEPDPLDHEEAADRLERRAKDESSVLAVCNTIDSAREITNALEGRLDAPDLGAVYAELLEDRDAPTGTDLAEEIEDRTDGPAIGHLSTRLRPIDRQRLIEAIKLLREREVPLVVASTQLIEAGVDVSFDRVYRDLAPIDSLVQAAGRCNRSFERDRGTVTIWWLESPDDSETTPAEAVYEMWGDSLISLTVNVLDSEGILTAESSVPEASVSSDAVEAYYETLATDRNAGKAEYVEHLDKAMCAQAGQLSLIDQRNAVDVVVCRTQTEREQIETINHEWNKRQFKSVRNRLDDLRATQVSVPVYERSSIVVDALNSLETVHPETELRWIAPGTPGYDDYFQATTGFVVPDSTVERRFL